MAALTILFSVQAFGAPLGEYFRVWQGFKKSELSQSQFLNVIPQFMDETVSLYDGYQALNNYLVVIPPNNKPDYVPDEFALVALSSEELYKEIRQTPAGQAYSNRHWDVFNKENSASAKTFVNYQLEKPSELVNNFAYDMFGKKIDWSAGHTRVFIGLKKQGLASTEFLTKLKSHIELAQRTFGPMGLKGYIVIANEKYEVAYMNWKSKEHFERAMMTKASARVSDDGKRIMDFLMFTEAQNYYSGDLVTEGSFYSTRN